MRNHPWQGAMKPFQVFGNTWFVGLKQASTHLIDTGDGLILLDSGYQESLYYVLDSIYQCGFSPYDIKYIIHSHGHIDHAAATRALVELTGAETFIGENDREMVNGTRPELTWGPEYNMAFNGTFEPDHLLKDGDKIALGDVVIDCAATPGHTAGTFSFFWDIKDEGKIYRAGTMGGAGINSMASSYLKKYDLPPEQWRGAFGSSIARCRLEKVDVFIGNHAKQNNTPERYEKLIAGDKLAFYDPEAWGDFLDQCQKNLDKLNAEDPL
ncbi:MAG: MBL fold metallo-hydrolase [Lentisphaerae bacterium]|nr:MBL fold metallo-hydrolase [Lentisphaerota bacterium]